MPKIVLQSAGVEFIDDNGGGLGVRLRKSPRQGVRTVRHLFCETKPIVALIFGNRSSLAEA